MKLFLIVSLVLNLTLFFSLTVEAAGCNPGKGVKLLYRKHIYRRAIEGLAQDVYVAYPKDSDTSTPNPNLEIVDFCVKDHDPNLFSAKPVFAYSVEEDLDRRLEKATIILRSQESRGINSTVEFYGFN